MVKMAKASFVFFLILVSGYASQTTAENCAEQAFKQCARPTDVLFMNIPGFPDEKLLVEHCDVIIEKVQCFFDSNNSCPIPELMEGMKSISSIKDLVEEICDEESTVRKNYRENVGCLNRNIETLQQSSNKVKIRFYDFQQNFDMNDEDVQVAMFCLEQEAFQLNAQNMIEQLCGEGGRTLFNTLNDRLQKENEVCSEADEIIQHYIPLLEGFKTSEEEPKPLLDLLNTI